MQKNLKFENMDKNETIENINNTKILNNNGNIKYNENINNIENTTQVCLCAIGKKENLYIKEFINHYKQLGYNHIYLYDNNDENDERFEDIIQEDINEGYVTLINYRGFRGTRNNPQLDAYYDCYEKNNRKYNWLSFFDTDEFLEIKPNNITIQEFFDNKRYNKCEDIKMHCIFR